ALSVFICLAICSYGGEVCVSGHDSGPVFEEQPSSLIYPEGLPEGKVTLNCQARASPAASYRWRVNGSEVLIGEHSHYTLVAGNLVINNPQHGRDSGSYQCLAVNRCGTIVSRAANLKFGYLRDFPLEGRSPQTAYEGTGTFLACQAPAHYPALSYRWILNEFPSFVQPDGGRWFVSQVTGNLYLANARTNDTGNYFCLTTINMDISTKSTFSKAVQLTVQPEATPRKSAPNIRVRFPSETYALAGHTTQLECFAYGNPTPKLRWRKVDGILPSKVGASADGPILTLPDLSFDDEGVYECEAYSSEGRDTHQGRVSVQGTALLKGLGLVCSVTETMSQFSFVTLNWYVLMLDARTRVHLCEAHTVELSLCRSHTLISRLQAPDFRLNPVRKLVPAARGGQVKMECKPRAAPKPTLFWSRGTELLTNSSRVTVMPDGVLWIYNISRADEGKYTCFAENYLGKANSTGHLSVRDATKITLAPSNADINQGENVTLQCHASHDPTMDLTFTWSLNGVLLDLEEPNGHYHRIEGKENIGDLAIVNTQLSQAGIYTCSAQTVVDSAVASGRLVVRGPPGPPGGLVVKSVNETAVELRWSRGYDNHSPIGKYVIMGRSEHSHDWKKMRTDPANIEGNAESARVIDLRPWMDYEFQVIASNILGSGEPSMPSQPVRTKQAAPTVAPSGLGGGGGDRNELIITWTVSNVSLPNTLYHVTVLAYNSAGTGQPSPRTTVITKKPPPNRPPGNVSWKTDGAWVTLRWDHVKSMDNESTVQGYKVLYKHEGQSALKVLDKGKTSVNLPLPKDNGYVVLEIRSWGEGGDGAAHEVIVSRDSGGLMITRRKTVWTWIGMLCFSSLFIDALLF
uniref:Contactin 2 n=1 Tax=Astyanax mexicanus TaxID=7994 RepID=A0A8B9RFT6_ASTMX